MLVNDLTRIVLRIRRENRRLSSLGYTKHETDWQLVRGGKRDWRIVDAKVSADGKHVWTKIEPGGGAHQGGER